MAFATAMMSHRPVGKQLFFPLSPRRNFVAKNLAGSKTIWQARWICDTTVFSSSRWNRQEKSPSYVLNETPTRFLGRVYNNCVENASMDPLPCPSLCFAKPPQKKVY